MSLIYKLKHAFGFAQADDDEELQEDRDDAVAQPFRRPVITLDPSLENRDDSKPEESHENSPADAFGQKSLEAKNAIMSEADRLRVQVKKLTGERDAAKQAQLSAERQKRAMTDRLYDLEAQAEQARRDNEKMVEEMRALTVKLRRVQEAAKPVVKPSTEAGAGEAAPNEEVEILRAELARRDEMIADLNTRLADEQRQNAIMRRDVETAAVKTKMADAMVQDLTAKAAKANRDLAEAREELEAATEAVKLLDRFDEYKQKQDIRVAEIKRQMVLKDKEIQSLNSTIEHNLRRHAEAMALLQREIETLRGEAPEDAVAQTDTPRRKGRGDKAAKEDKDDKPELKPRIDPQLTLF